MIRSRDGFPFYQNQLLGQACWLLALGFALNSGYSALHFAFGWGEHYFLPGPQDRFADLVKVALSFKDYTAKLAASIDFQSWPRIYKEYLQHNPYSGIEGLTTGQLTHMHHPPLSQLSFTICTMLIATTKSVTCVLWVWFGIYVACVAWLITTYLKCMIGKLMSAFPLLILCFASYPALLVFTRGNYHAGFSSILVVVFLVSCFGLRKLSLPPVLALAMATNFRPTAVIFLLAIPLVLGWRKSVVPIATTITLMATIFIAALAIENALYPDYDFHNFLKGLEIYKSHYIIGSMGDAGNASLWALIKNSATLSGTILFYPEELYWVFLALSTLAILLAWRSLRTEGLNTQAGPLVLVALYILLSPVCAEYHLLVCVAPLAILSLQGHSNIQNEKVIFWTAALILIPKNFIFVDGISLQTLINPLALLVALLLLQPPRLASLDKLKGTPVL